MLTLILISNYPGIVSLFGHARSRSCTTPVTNTKVERVACSALGDLRSDTALVITSQVGEFAAARRPSRLALLFWNTSVYQRLSPSSSWYATSDFYHFTRSFSLLQVPNSRCTTANNNISSQVQVCKTKCGKRSADCEDQQAEVCMWRTICSTHADDFLTRLIMEEVEQFDSISLEDLAEGLSKLSRRMIPS
jgi:hypothetical protein